MTAEDNMMDENVDAVDALARLEAALDRIAEGSRPGPIAQVAEPAGAEMAERLDALIAQLRGALATETPPAEVPPTDTPPTEALATEASATEG